jgi:hypothetical protein
MRSRCTAPPAFTKRSASFVWGFAGASPNRHSACFTAGPRTCRRRFRSFGDSKRTGSSSGSTASWHEARLDQRVLSPTNRRAPPAAAAARWTRPADPARGSRRCRPGEQCAHALHDGHMRQNAFCAQGRITQCTCMRSADGGHSLSTRSQRTATRGLSATRVSAAPIAGRGLTWRSS